MDQANEDCLNRTVKTQQAEIANLKAKEIQYLQTIEQLMSLSKHLTNLCELLNDARSDDPNV